MPWWLLEDLGGVARTCCSLPLTAKILLTRKILLVKKTETPFLNTRVWKRQREGDFDLGRTVPVKVPQTTLQPQRELRALRETLPRRLIAGLLIRRLVFARFLVEIVRESVFTGEHHRGTRGKH
jgi:hypothetical protein